LFPENVSGGETGLQGLQDWLEKTRSRQFDGTSNHIGGHVIDFEDADHAQGKVYSENEHESGAESVNISMMYFDRYERIAGR